MSGQTGQRGSGSGGGETDSFWPSWQHDAACRRPGVDPDVFYPEKGGSARPARAVCAGCPVTAQCLEYALANDERFGFWGGLSERERRLLKRQAAA